MLCLKKKKDVGRIKQVVTGYGKCGLHIKMSNSKTNIYCWLFDQYTAESLKKIGQKHKVF